MALSCHSCYFTDTSSTDIDVRGRPNVAIGFSDGRDQTLWTFFTSLTLALLTAYQAINFCLAFFRVVRAILDQRRIEVTATDETHLFRGTAWISAALKLVCK